MTLPKRITQAIGDAEYFEVKVEDGQIILTPVKIQRANAVRAKLAALELSEQDIADAVAWARQP
jgi:hypothetical protein